MIEVEKSALDVELLDIAKRVRERKADKDSLMGFTLLEPYAGRFGYKLTPPAHNDEMLLAAYWEVMFRITNDYRLQELKKALGDRFPYARSDDDYVLRVVMYEDWTDGEYGDLFARYDMYSTVLGHVVRVMDTDNGLAIERVWTVEEYERTVRKLGEEPLRLIGKAGGTEVEK